MGVQLCLHHPPGCEDEHRRRGALGQARAYLDGPVQDSGSRSLLRRRDPGRLTGGNLLYLDLPSDLPGSDARRRVAIERCKPCANTHDSGDMPKYLPAGLTQYVLNNFPRSPLRITSLKTVFRHTPNA